MGDVICVTGMVISSMPVNDYDKRVVLLTKERGKISAFAKGARRMNSPLMGCSNPFCFGTFKVYEGRTSYNIQSADIDNYFQDIATDIDCVYYGIYFMELADYYTYENMDAGRELNLLYAAFRALKKEAIPNALVRYVFELKMMVLHGSYPQVFECDGCKKEDGLIYFSAAKGAVYCNDCVHNAPDSIEINQSTLYALQYIITTPIAKLFTFTVTEDVLRELKMIMGRLALLVIDRKLKSLEMLELSEKQ
ncbi:MAG: DNA repair protein RecO [Lachnospiraceae bacterium]